MKPNAESRPLLEPPSTLDDDDGAERFRSCGDGDLVAHAHIACDVALDTVLDARGFTAER
jgi:hypothetical protein